MYSPWLCKFTLFDELFFQYSLAAYVLFSVTKDMAFLSALLVPVPQGQIADNIACSV